MRASSSYGALIRGRNLAWSDATKNKGRGERNKRSGGNGWARERECPYCRLRFMTETHAVYCSRECCVSARNKRIAESPEFQAKVDPMKIRRRLCK